MSAWTASQGSAPVRQYFAEGVALAASAQGFAVGRVPSPGGLQAAQRGEGIPPTGDNLVNGRECQAVRVRGLRAVASAPVHHSFSTERDRLEPGRSADFGEREREPDGASAWTARHGSAPVRQYLSTACRRPEPGRAAQFGEWGQESEGMSAWTASQGSAPVRQYFLGACRRLEPPRAADFGGWGRELDGASAWTACHGSVPVHQYFPSGTPRP